MNQKILGNIIATLLILLVVWSVLYMVFVFLFRDGRGLPGLYGREGDIYMAEPY